MGKGQRGVGEVMKSRRGQVGRVSQKHRRSQWGRLWAPPAGGAAAATTTRRWRRRVRPAAAAPPPQRRLGRVARGAPAGGPADAGRPGGRHAPGRVTRQGGRGGAAGTGSGSTRGAAGGGSGGRGGGGGAGGVGQAGGGGGSSTADAGEEGAERALRGTRPSGWLSAGACKRLCTNTNKSLCNCISNVCIVSSCMKYKLQR